VAPSVIAVVNMIFPNNTGRRSDVVILELGIFFKVFLSMFPLMKLPSPPPDKDPVESHTSHHPATRARDADGKKEDGEAPPATEVPTLNLDLQFLQDKERSNFG
jgi:hypothetical protein